ncbi:glycosyltransferase family 4 protein [Engelhardtia mirabilis]|uniref:2-deoxystreptamine glucosyltransferase n=1 Tax=Engelhardtia mirabilis TaxID=2528011 RepID=A0A518BKC9_9BACT|nr:2-deoxystreptamine glucosyltransferase [Planctomycetes bacterium Pla133]QDV01757.1 2-deoxystreptamine glucosyltransferase [Planctomycetes bacterium Pla86]
MKVLYHHRTQAEDGQAIHIRALQDALRSEGHEVHEVALVSQSESRGAAAELEQQRSRFGWIDRVPGFVRELAEYGYSAVARRRIVAAGRALRPDFIYERYAFGNFGGLWAARSLGVPFLLEVNSPMVLELGRTRGLSFPGLAARVENSVFRRSDRVCVVTRVLGDMLVELGVDPARILVTPNGVDLECYPQARDAALRRAARAELGLAPEPEGGGTVLGFVGYYRDWHRLDLAVAALAEPGLEQAELVLIGEGPAREGLEAAAARAGVTGRLHFAGRRSHERIPDLLAAFDVALLPAINPYASPLKLHEYMAAHLPTVAPDQPNLREVLENGRDAVLVPANDGDAFASALIELCRDAELRARLGAAARDTIESRDLTWRGNARRVVGAAQEELDRR